MAALQMQLRREQLRVQSLEKDLEQKVNARTHRKVFKKKLCNLYNVILFSLLRLKKSKMSQNCVMSYYLKCKSIVFSVFCSLFVFVCYLYLFSPIVINKKCYVENINLCLDVSPHEQQL